MSAQSLMPWGNRGREVGDPFRNLQREIDRLFASVTPNFGFPASSGGSFGLFAPPIDVSESENSFQVRTELPGVEKNEVEVTFEDGVLTVRGERKQESEEQKKSFHVKEMSYGSFRRAVQLPAEVDFEKAKAEFTNGVLTITLPKAPSAQKKVRKIEVQGS